MGNVSSETKGNGVVLVKGEPEPLGWDGERGRYIKLLEWTPQAS